MQLENILRAHKDEFEALLNNGYNKPDIKLFINKYVYPVVNYKSTTYYLDIYFALRRIYFKLSNKNEMENSFEKALNQPPPTNDQIIAALPVYAAVERLRMELTEDEGYRIGWQSNIAEAFMCAVEKYVSDNGMHYDDDDRAATLHIANTAAKNFLNSLCSTSTCSDLKKD